MIVAANLPVDRQVMVLKIILTVKTSRKTDNERFFCLKMSV